MISARNHRLLLALAALPFLAAGAGAAKLIPAAAPTSAGQAQAAAQQAAAQATVIRQRAADFYSQSGKILSAIQAAQNAARAAAGNANNLGTDPNHPGQTLPNVPDGLSTGGLNPDSGLSSTGVANTVTTWTGANTPTQTAANGTTTVTIVQTSQNALLNWQSFNIGKNTILQFDQSAGGSSVGNWIAFNQIVGPSGASPSQILGQIQAPGQVYVINQNGIIFGGHSQVNVHTLVASSLPFNASLVGQIDSNPNLQYLFSALPTDFTGDVTVQAGAQLTSPTTADHVGGRIVLVGPNVTNNGTIEAPDGQIILAAGLQVGFSGHNTDDPTLAGLDAFVGAVSANGDAATNTGQLDAPRGDIMMTGVTVNQFGAATSTTSVSHNGRIDLLADYGAAVIQPSSATGTAYFMPTMTGTVNLGDQTHQSLTEILPELQDTTDVVAGTQLGLSSIVDIQGLMIHLAQNSILLAPSAALPTSDTAAGTPVLALGIDGQALTAGVTLDAGQWMRPDTLGTTPYQFVHTSGQVYVDTGAVIDVAGSEDVAASVADNIVSVKLQGPELADSPLQRNGALRGQTVEVDLRQHGPWDPTLNGGAGGYTWVGTPLADVSGEVGQIQHTVGQLTTAGGSVAINAGTSVVLQSGSTVDVSGGWINYAGATLQTSQVISNGVAYNVASASPNLVYSGVSSTMTSYYDPGYIQGGNGGSLTINAPGMALDGHLYGNTVTGTRQLGTTPNAASTLATVLALSRPNFSTLSLAFVGQNPVLPTNGQPAFSLYAPTPPSVVFQNGSLLPAAGAFDAGDPALSSARLAEIDLSPQLLSGEGFGNLSVKNGDGKITVAAGITLAAPAGGSIILDAANIEIDGNVSAPGGTLGFTAYDISPYEFVAANDATPVYDSTRGLFTLGAGASLSTAGLVVDDRANGALSLIINGGSISITASTVDLSSGRSIDASGGVLVDSSGAITYGTGGSISILSGKDAAYTTPGGRLTLGAMLTAYSGLATGGGSLTLEAPLIQLGGSTPADPDTIWIAATGADGTLSFFNQGGFGSFSLTGIGEEGSTAFDIADGTHIAPRAQTRQAVITGSGISWLAPAAAAAGLRTPVDLSFTAAGVKDPLAGLEVRGDLVMGAGASIVTDPQANAAHGVHLKAANGTVTVLGSIVAPGGTIGITGAADSTSLLFPDQGEALATVYLGADSLLSTAGVFLPSPISDPRGYRTGTVFGGGTIDLVGNIVAEEGAVLNVSGASAVLDLSPATAGSYRASAASSVVATRVDSAGGAITFDASQGLYTEATLLGAAGGPSAEGGTLNVSSGAFYPINIVAHPDDIDLIVTQSRSGLPLASGLGAGLAIPADPAVPVGPGGVGGYVVGGYFSVDSFADRYDGAGRLVNGGFDALVLGGNVEFVGDVSIAARRQISVADGGFLSGDGVSTISLSAPHVALGAVFAGPQTSIEAAQDPYQFNNNPYYVMPTTGGGKLVVTASDLIDVGDLSLKGIGDVTLIADTGDIRGDGTLDVAGAITLRAGQIYPTTESVFNVIAYDYAGGTGSVTIDPSATGTVRSLPLTAGGTLNIFATNIVQGGTLRAPIGIINLGWNGTGVSPVDPITGAGIQGSLLANSNVAAIVPAAQSLTLSATSVTAVSAVDPVTGLPVVIPYGINQNGVNWIDPAGQDITSGTGAPAKAVNLSAVGIDDQAGAKIDISGGGDLYAYQWVQGNGGSKDILASTGSFAVIPGYAANYMPADGGGTNSYGAGSTLAIGDSIYLSAGSGLPAGYYTLLPARYALLPGAFLVTPQGGAAGPAVQQNDGSSIVSGYRVNTLSPTTPLPYSSFEVDPASVVRSRAEYDDAFANTTFPANAAKNSAATPRLPDDAGQLVFNATGAMEIQGQLLAQAAAGGLGGEVDIGSPSNILINASGTLPTGASGLVLKTSDLDSFGNVSLLIGGVREYDPSGTTVVVSTGSLTVDTAGGPALTGSDLILVSNGTLTLADGTQITQTGTVVAEALRIENQQESSNGAAPGGDGALLRVSSDAGAGISRVGAIDHGVPATIDIGRNVGVSGQGIIVDSTSTTTFDPTARLLGSSVSLDSGRISLQLDNPGALQTADSLVLSSSALASLQQGAQSLSLLSYSSIDIYGQGQIGGVDGNVPTLQSLALHAGEIRGFNAGTGVTINAQTLQIDNSPGVAATGAVAVSGGLLTFNAQTIVLGNNALAVDQYAGVDLTATNAIVVAGAPITSASDTPDTLLAPSSLSVAGALTLAAPVVTGNTGAAMLISATGALQIDGSGTPGSIATQGLGTKLTLQGQTVTDSGTIRLVGGDLILHATGGDVTVDGTADVSGLAKPYYDQTEVVNGGMISLVSDTGSVGVTGKVDVSAPADGTDPAGGSAGSLSVSAAQGTFTFSKMVSGQTVLGTLLGQGGAGGEGGTFSLDVGSLPSLADLEASLEPVSDVKIDGISHQNIGGFTKAQTLRVRKGNVVIDGTVAAESITISADGSDSTLSAPTGTITVTGNIIATASQNGEIDSTLGADGRLLSPGATGGSIDLTAYGNVTLNPNSLLTVEGTGFNSAGQGGSVTLEAGAETNGVSGPGYVNIAGGTIDLSVDAVAAYAAAYYAANIDENPNLTLADATAQAIAHYQSQGQFTGKLLIEAPQTVGNTNLQVDAIQGAILNASSLVIAGNQVFNLSGTGGAITKTGTTQAAGGVLGAGVNVEASIQANGNTFTGNTSAILTGLFGASGNPYGNVLQVEPGAEIVNTNGNLTLASDWDLSTYRFGPSLAPGILTLRAAGNLVFHGSLSDGFTSKGVLYQAPVSALNTLLPTDNQSWSYNLAAGADFSGADFHDVVPLASLGANGGSLDLGVVVPGTSNNGNPAYTGGTPATAQTASVIAGYYQVIRTGTGDIDIATAGNVELLNDFATIYTAGALAPDQTLGGTFATPKVTSNGSQGTLGSLPTATFTPQYTLGGGDVTIAAQGSIEHLTSDAANDGGLVDDSEKQLPMDWLYRRDYVAGNGLFGSTKNLSTIDASTSTTWWVDFSNFFEGIGTLGGGNVVLSAGQNVSNVDAVVATNARMPGLKLDSATGKYDLNIAPNAASLIELGGGNLTVTAGNNINGGVYYVERGTGTLSAGYQVVTNETRSPTLGTLLTSTPTVTTPYAWLPTTLFLGGSDGGGGSASFSVAAWGDLLLGPAANPFLLPEGLGNTFWDKTYFSTYSTADAVNVSSLTGDVTLRTAASTTDANSGPLLYLWLHDMLLYSTSATGGNSTGYASYQPWLRLDETSVEDFTTVASLMPGSLNITAYSGDIDLQGSITLSPSPTGQINLIAAGALNGLQQIGLATNPSNGSLDVNYFSSSVINLSDANPAQIPGITNPYAYASALTASGATSISASNMDNTSSTIGFFKGLDSLLTESDSITGVNASQLPTLHALINNGPLHSGDDEPVRLYALGGDISGLTLFAGKSAQVVAGEDITDISLYIENNQPGAVSIVSAGRDILPYDASAPLLANAQNALLGNLLADGPEAGDIQIGGPGTLEVLAGRNLNLGTQPPSADGTGLGITSIGNGRNPSLSSFATGADIVAAAGVGFGGTNMGQLDFPAFEAQFLTPGTAEDDRYLPDLGTLMGLPAGSSDQVIAAAYGQLISGDESTPQTREKASTYALDIFYLVLRDAGRDHNDPSSPGYGVYTAGYAAIAALFPGSGAASSTWQGDITLTAREIKTKDGGSISLLAPGGQVLVGFSINGTQPVDQGILTEYGGDISIFADQSVLLGTSRVFTLRGGNEILWSSNGDLNAGASSTTVQSAPPTRVLIDPGSANVQVDLAGIATGGGIGALESVAGVAPADIDLIAPRGVIDAGDAGIRVSGNLNVAAVQVLNSANISVGGKSAGVPTVTAPNVGGLTAAASAAAGASNSADEAARQSRDRATAQQPADLPSIISVEVIGYGGGDSAANAADRSDGAL